MKRLKYNVLFLETNTNIYATSTNTKIYREHFTSSL